MPRHQPRSHVRYTLPSRKFYAFPHAVIFCGEDAMTREGWKDSVESHQGWEKRIERRERISPGRKYTRAGRSEVARMFQARLLARYSRWSRDKMNFLNLASICFLLSRFWMIGKANGCWCFYQSHSFDVNRLGNSSRKTQFVSRKRNGQTEKSLSKYDQKEKKN